MKKSLAAMVSLLVLLMAVSGCSSQPAKNSPTDNTDKKQLQVGIVQLVEHPSLDTIRTECIAQLAKDGFKDGDNIVIDYQNGQNDQTNLKTICQKFSNKKYDLIIAIATSSAQAAVGETSTIPVVFAACTDPVGSGLVTDLTKPGKNVTGTSDAVSAAQIMDLAQRITPGIKTIGALYSSSETNSISVIKGLKDYAKKNGMTVVEATVTNSSEAQQAASSLVGKVDAMFTPIDNTIASAMPIVAQVTKRAKIPFYVGADSMVKDGGLATYGVNYTQLGQETGSMAAEILKGKKPGDIPVKTWDTFDIYINQATADAIGVTIPDDVKKEAAQTFNK